MPHCHNAALSQCYNAALPQCHYCHNAADAQLASLATLPQCRIGNERCRLSYLYGGLGIRFAASKTNFPEPSIYEKRNCFYTVCIRNIIASVTPTK